MLPRTTSLLVAMVLFIPAWAAADDEIVDGFGSIRLQTDRLKAQQQDYAQNRAAEDAAAAERRRLVPAAGHGRPGWVYDIWQHNCHNAANEFLDRAPDQTKAGIVTCAYDPSQVHNWTKNPMVFAPNHTFNWIVLPTQTCLYNWGKACCWPATTIPPNIASGPGKVCAMTDCGSQYSNTTQPFPAGMFVEEPRPAECADIVMGGTPTYGAIPPEPDTSPTLKGTCETCCDERTDQWRWEQNPGSPANSQKAKESFRSSCKSRCDEIFTAENTSQYKQWAGQ